MFHLQRTRTGSPTPGRNEATRPAPHRTPQLNCIRFSQRALLLANSNSTTPIPQSRRRRRGSSDQKKAHERQQNRNMRYGNQEDFLECTVRADVFVEIRAIRNISGRLRCTSEFAFSFQDTKRRKSGHDDLLSHLKMDPCAHKDPLMHQWA